MLSTLPERSTCTALEHAAATLAPVHETGRLDAEVLLGHVLGRPRHRVYAWPEESMDANAYERYRLLVARRAAGEPVAHLTGRREFWSMDLEVTSATLIPRPETEHLVEVALAVIPPDAAWRVADLGTGSGAVALAIAKERPHCRITATDVSSAALTVAERNAQRLGVHNAMFSKGDWCAALAGVAQELIVSNPPYVAEHDPHLRRGDVRFEPRAALVAGPDGLDAIGQIAREARRCLRRRGGLILEHGYDQGPRVRQLLRSLGYRQPRSHKDYAAHERITEAVWMGS